MSTVEKLEADATAADRAFDDMTPEEVRRRWAVLRDIPGFEGIYACTCDGKIWAHPRSWQTGKDGKIQLQHGGKWLRQNIGAAGYLLVNLNVSGKKRAMAVHRLIALAWIPNPERLPQINHIDGVKTNNASSNMEWCTASHNKRHAHAMGLCPITERFLASVRRNVLKAHAATRAKFAKAPA